MDLSDVYSHLIQGSLVPPESAPQTETWPETVAA